MRLQPRGCLLEAVVLFLEAVEELEEPRRLSVQARGNCMGPILQHHSS